MQRRHLILRLSGPMMSFGGPRVDEFGTVLPFPTTAMISGLLANCLGLKRTQHQEIESLQERITIAARIDRAGFLLHDYQTARLDEVPGHDAFGKGKRVTHVAHRDFYADRIVTVAVDLAYPDRPEDPTIADLELAVLAPKRPIFLGRANCPPGEPILVGVVEADTSDGALSIVPRHPRADPGPLPAIWPSRTGCRPGDRVSLPGDRRDIANGIGVGRTLVLRGHLTPPDAPVDGSHA